jgi:hypothetical protein
MQRTSQCPTGRDRTKGFGSERAGEVAYGDGTLQSRYHPRSNFGDRVVAGPDQNDVGARYDYFEIDDGRTKELRRARRRAWSPRGDPGDDVPSSNQGRRDRRSDAARACESDAIRGVR